MFFCNICNNLIYFRKTELQSLICNICKNQKKPSSNMIIKYRIWTPGIITQSWNSNIIKLCLNPSSPIISRFKCNKCINTKLLFFLKKDRDSTIMYFFCSNCKRIYIKKI
ncbi:hypothetical protein M951_chr198 (nucleomorph) [Lotharella oceanica]|uniref:Uncharacterized protein n=1 Tax=Lotharella oceanica TaxID=641309 RepID=A0A060DAN8_9EUKA|nr:hypothetical protein M951_chr198 [Lotharella oceanica]